MGGGGGDSLCKTVTYHITMATNHKFHCYYYLVCRDPPNGTQLNRLYSNLPYKVTIIFLIFFLQVLMFAVMTDVWYDQLAVNVLLPPARWEALL